MFNLQNALWNLSKIVKSMSHPSIKLQCNVNSKTPHSKFNDFKSSGREKDKDKMCALCDFKFTMFKRQHHCRLCDVVCCDECSKKKAVVEHSQVRHCAWVLPLDELFTTLFYLCKHFDVQLNSPLSPL